MPVSLTFDELGDGLGDAWTVLRDNAARAGLEAPVPTCPGWQVRDLVAHQGMVHRWAVDALRGGSADEDGEAYQREGLASGDLLAWFDEGARDLLATLAFAPVDLDAWFFLKDAPPPRVAWARRQCHETTIHAVDAMSAALGRVPRAEETWVRGRLAADGIDELLLGFLPRRSFDDAFPAPTTVVVRTSDTGDVWSVRLGAGRVTARAGEPDALPGEEAVVELSGTAAQLYLSLWNRGDGMRATTPEVLDRWRRAVRILW